jgi:hypothetical protein
MGVPGGFFDDVVQAGTGALAAALFTLVVTFISTRFERVRLWVVQLYPVLIAAFVMSVVVAGT